MNLLFKISADMYQEVHDQFALVRTFDDTGGFSSVVGDNHISVRLPISTDDHHKSVVLRANDHILCASDRWAVCWDDEAGTISNSMRPPPLPLVSGGDKTPSASQSPLQEINEEAVPIGSGRVRASSSQSTCSPTPSRSATPRRGGEAGEADKQPDESREVAAITAEPAALSVQSSVVAQVALRNDVKHVPGALIRNDAAKASVDDVQDGPGEPLLAEPEGSPAEPVNEGEEFIWPQRDNTPPAEAVTPTSDETADEDQEVTGAEAPPRSGDLTGTKRRLAETETLASSINASGDDYQMSNDGEQGDTILINRRAKGRRTYSSKNRRNALQTPSRQTTRKASARIATPDSSTSTQPPSAKRLSTRANSASSGDSIDHPPVVIFSSTTKVDDNKKTMQTFRQLGGKTTAVINKATVLCISEGSVKKTSKLLMAVLLGIDVVTEDWVVETHRLGRFPAVEEYLPLDADSEQEWETSLKDAIVRGKQGLTHLLTGTTVFFTKKLRSDLGNLERDFSQIATLLGAESVQRRVPTPKDNENATESTVLVVGVLDDPQAAKVAEMGYTLFNKDILTMAALRGRLEKDCNDFVIEVPIKDEEEEL